MCVWRSQASIYLLVFLYVLDLGNKLLVLADHEEELEKFQTYFRENRRTNCQDISNDGGQVVTSTCLQLALSRSTALWQKLHFPDRFDDEWFH